MSRGPAAARLVLLVLGMLRSLLVLRAQLALPVRLALPALVAGLAGWNAHALLLPVVRSTRAVLASRLAARSLRPARALRRPAAVTGPMTVRRLSAPRRGA